MPSDAEFVHTYKVISDGEVGRFTFCALVLSSVGSFDFSWLLESTSAFKRRNTPHKLKLQLFLVGYWRGVAVTADVLSHPPISLLLISPSKGLGAKSRAARRFSLFTGGAALRANASPKALNRRAFISPQDYLGCTRCTTENID